MNKKLFLLAATILFFAEINFAQVGIGTATPNTSAQLDVTSTNKGLLMPRMTTIQRTGIATPATGLQVFDIDTKTFWFWNETGWIEISTGAATNYWGLNGTNIFKTNTGNVGIGLNTPLVPLHIKNDNEALRIQGITPYISFYDNTGINKSFIQNFNSDLYLGTPSTNTTGIMQFYLTNNPVMTILPSGNVGIGTAAPSSKFMVQTLSRDFGFSHTDGTVIVGSYIGDFGASGSGGWLGTKTNHALNFYTNNSLAQMTIVPGGNVGIGTTNPAFKMDVGGRMRIRTQADGNTAGIWLNDPANTNTIAFMGIANSATTGFYGNVSGWGLIMNTNTGNVGIGTLNPTYKLSVNGNVRSKEVVVETGWADYVFDKKYNLLPLEDIEKFIEKHNHLPGIPSAAEVEKNGLPLGDTQKKMMEKIEELTLYMIEANKKIDRLELLIKQQH